MFDAIKEFSGSKLNRMKVVTWFWTSVLSATTLIGVALFLQPVSWFVRFLVLLLALVSLISGIILWWQASQKDRQNQVLIKQIQSLEEQTYTKYENIVRISQRFVTATDESQILNWALALMVDVVNAKAATFTPIDELGATLTTRVEGDLPPRISKDWLEYFSSPVVRRKCPNCSQSERMTTDHCPLLYGSESQLKIYCVPIRRLDRELGIFHLVLAADARVEREQEYLLRLISDQTALALEGARLRSREVYAYAQLESVKQHLDVGFFIEELLRGLIHGLRVQAAIVSVWDFHLKKPIKDFSVGIIDEKQKVQILSTLPWRNLTKHEKTQSKITIERDGAQLSASLLSIPIPIERKEIRGVLQVVQPSTQDFTEKQEEMLKAIVTQIAFLLQNANLLAEVEIKAILQERIRLAREIHDGLAQTLGFLKLKVSQLRAYLEQGEVERANQNIQLLHQAISDAYIEARHAIDQLRISIYDAPLVDLIQEALDEFRESSGIPCEFIVEPQDLRLPVEINAQLVRIIQESLSNIRKHAYAHHVQIQTAVKGDWLILEVRDDGVGFQPEEVSRHSQYGLRGMKERAELIGAELQIISQPNEGATVQVRLPLSQIERSWQT